MATTWRDSARAIIQRVLTETVGKSEAEIKKALFDAYPFHERKHHPYKIWLDEIKIQRKQRRLGQRPEKPNPNQTKLFK